MKSSKGISTPYLLAIIGVLISGMVMSIEVDTLIGLQDDAIAQTLPLVAQRTEAVMISVGEIDRASVELDLQRELNLTTIEGETPALIYNGVEAAIQPGMDFQIEEGSGDSICIVQKPSEPVKIAAGEC